MVLIWPAQCAASPSRGTSGFPVRFHLIRPSTLKPLTVIGGYYGIMMWADEYEHHDARKNPADFANDE